MLEDLFLLAEGRRLLELLRLEIHVLLTAHALELFLDFLQLRRRGQRHETGAGGGLVDHVDRLVGQLAIGDVAVGQRHRGVDGLLGDLDSVMGLVLVAQALDDLDRLRHGGRLDDDRLEAALEGAILLDVLAVLVQRGGADRLDLAAGQRRLEHVRGVDRALGGAGPDERVQLVEEEDDVLRLADLLHDRLQALLELAAILGAGHQGAEVELQEPLVHQHVRHVVSDDLLGQALDDRRLADAGLADEHGIVLGAAGQDLDDALDLLLAADHRVELGLAGQLGEVAGELVEHRRLRALLRARVVLVAQQRQRLLADLVEPRAERLQDLGGDRLAFLHETQQQVLGSDVIVTELARLLDRELEDALGLRGEGHLAERERLGEAGERALDLGFDVLQPEPETLQDRGCDPLTVADEPEQHVLGSDEVVAEAARFFASQDDDPSRPLGEPFEHFRPYPFRRPLGVGFSCEDG